jgi:hypothetical protein
VAALEPGESSGIPVVWGTGESVHERAGKIPQANIGRHGSKALFSKAFFR